MYADQNARARASLHEASNEGRPAGVQPPMVEEDGQLVGDQPAIAATTADGPRLDEFTCKCIDKGQGVHQCARGAAQGHAGPEQTPVTPLRDGIRHGAATRARRAGRVRHLQRRRGKSTYFHRITKAERRCLLRRACWVASLAPRCVVQARQSTCLTCWLAHARAQELDVQLTFEELRSGSAGQPEEVAEEAEAEEEEEHLAAQPREQLPRHAPPQVQLPCNSVGGAAACSGCQARAWKYEWQRCLAPLRTARPLRRPSQRGANRRLRAEPGHIAGDGPDRPPTRRAAKKSRTMRGFMEHFVKVMVQMLQGNDQSQLMSLLAGVLGGMQARGSRQPSPAQAWLDGQRQPRAQPRDKGKDKSKDHDKGKDKGRDKEKAGDSTMRDSGSGTDAGKVRGKGGTAGKGSGGGSAPQQQPPSRRQQPDAQEAWQTVRGLRSEDFDAPICTVDDLERKAREKAGDGTQQRPVLGVVLARDDDDCKSIETLLSIHGHLRVLRVRPLEGPDARECALQQQEEPRQLFGRARGHTRVRAVGLWRSHPDAPRYKTTVTKAAPAAAPTDTAVLRVSAEKRYTTEWERILKRPGDTARAWGLAAGRTDASKLRDTFKWFQQGEIIVGLWRVEQSAVTGLLAASGQADDQGHRFFMEPMRWEAPNPAPTPACAYQKRLEDEDWSQYAIRIASMAGELGIARGDRALGIRTPRASTDARTRTWKLESVPAGHSYTDVSNLLRAQGLADIVFIAQRGCPRVPGSALPRKTWVVRAAASGELNGFEIEQRVSGEEVQMYGYIEAPRRSAAPWQRLPGERAVSFAKDPRSAEDKPRAPSRALLEVPDKEAPALMEAGATAAAVSGGEAGNNDEGSAKRPEPAGKRPALAPAAPAPPPWPAWLRTIPNPGGGDCLPHALSQGLKRQNVHVDQETVRFKLATQVAKNSSKYAEFWDGLAPQAAEKKLDTFEEYMRLAGKPGAWLGNLEIQAYAECFHGEVVVHQRQGPPRHFKPPSAVKKPLQPLRLRYDGAHYELIVSSPPGDDAKSVPCAPKGGRGGGGSRASSEGPQASVASTAASIRKRRRRAIAEFDAAGHAAGSHGTPSLASSAQGYVAQEPPRTSRCVAPRGSAGASASAAAPSDEPPAPGLPTGGPTQQWTCPHAGCKGFTVRQPFLYQKKAAHAAIFHAKVRDQMHLRPNLVMKLPAGTTARWQCPCCPKAMAADPASPAGARSRLKHGATEHPDEDPKKFYLPKGQWRSSGGVAAANAARAAAWRVKNLLGGKTLGHQIVFFRMPGGPRKGRTHVRCTTCFRQGRSVRAFGQCRPLSAQTGKTTQAIATARGWLEAAPPAEQTEIQEYLDWLLKAREQARSRELQRILDERKPDRDKHTVHQFRWPLGDKNTKGRQRFVCMACGMLKISRAALEGRACGQRMTKHHFARRVRLLARLRRLRRRSPDLETAIEALAKARGSPTEAAEAAAEAAAAAAPRGALSAGGSAGQAASSRRF